MKYNKNYHSDITIYFNHVQEHTLRTYITTHFSMVIPSSCKCATFPCCIALPQTSCLLKIPIKITVKIKMLNTKENAEMGLQKLGRAWTRLESNVTIL